MAEQSATSSRARVACIQSGTPSLSRTENINILRPLIEKAAANKAQLVLLPEFATVHYEWNSRIWQSGEVFDIHKSQTLAFLHEMSKKHRIHLATTLLEVDKVDFYNTFVLFDDNGNIIGKIRKNTSPGLESYYYHGSNDAHILKTRKFGNIAVAICLENHLSKIENEIISVLRKNEKINLLLSPHCVMLAKVDLNAGVTQENVDNVNQNIDTICIDLSRKYHLNVLFSNKTGSFQSPIPILRDYLVDTTYAGLTKVIKPGGVVDSGCQAKDADLMDDSGEIVIGDVDLSVLDQVFKEGEYRYSKGICNSLCKMNKANKVLNVVHKAFGFVYYRCSVKRRVTAAMIYDGRLFPYLSKTFLNAAFLFVMYKLYRRRTLEQ